MLFDDGSKKIEYTPVIPINVRVGAPTHSLVVSDYDLSGRIVYIDDYRSAVLQCAELGRVVVVEDEPNWKDFVDGTSLRVGYGAGSEILFGSTDDISFIEPKYAGRIEGEIILVIGLCKSLAWYEEMSWSKLITPRYNSELIPGGRVEGVREIEVREIEDLSEVNPRGNGVLFVADWREEIESSLRRTSELKGRYDYVVDTGKRVVNGEILNETRREFEMKRSLVNDGGVIYLLVPVGDLEKSELVHWGGPFNPGYRRMLEIAIEDFEQYNSEDVVSKQKLRTVLGLACILQCIGPSPFLTDEISQYIGETDVHTYVNLFWDIMIKMYCARTYDSYGYPVNNSLKEYCSNYLIDYEAMLKMVRLLATIESELDATLLEKGRLKDFLPIQGRKSLARVAEDKAVTHYETLGNYAREVFRLAFSGNTISLDTEEKYDGHIPGELSHNLFIDYPYRIVTDTIWFNGTIGIFVDARE